MSNEYPIAVGEKVMLRYRMSYKDVYYAGGMINGSRMLDFFGDVATELTLRLYGNEGLYRTYEHIDFLAPVYANDVIEYIGWITRVGNTSIQFHLEAWKVMEDESRFKEGGSEENGVVLNPPILVGQADSIGVVPKHLQFGPQDPKFALKK